MTDTMKKFFKIITFGIILFAGCSIFLSGCTNSIKNSETRLDNENDSLSYAVSMLMSENVPMIMAREDIDSTTIEAFIKGLETSFPLDDAPQTRAFISGIYLGAEATEMLNRADKAIYPDDKEKKVNRKKFLEALVATARNSSMAMDMQTAKEYYNHRVFRMRSEQFIENNRKRPGVVTLPSGVQYKVESMGKGTTATISDTVVCIYKGMYPNGAVFASSRGESTEFALCESVPGLAEVLTTLPAGTRCMAYIPWQLAYGAEGKNGIMPYSTLVYDIEIVGIK